LARCGIETWLLIANSRKRTSFYGQVRPRGAQMVAPMQQTAWRLLIVFAKQRLISPTRTIIRHSKKTSNAGTLFRL
jgi:hypothetical protein